MPKFKNTDQYIAACGPPVAALLTDLRAFIHDTLPEVTEGMQYGVPVFFNAHKVAVIYLFGAADHVNFGFLKYARMHDPDGVLQGSGKPSKHIEIQPGGPVDKETLQVFVDQCATMKPA